MTTEKEQIINAIKTLSDEGLRISLYNIAKIVKTEQPIDEDCVGCCKVVDVAAKLQEELESTNKTIKELKDRITFDAKHIDRLNKVITSHINEIRDLETTIDEKDKMLEKYGREIWCLRDKVSAIEDELSARKHDSEVLEKVVENTVKDYLNAPEGPPKTPIDEKTCLFCGCKNPSINIGRDWYCSMKCADGQADVNKYNETPIDEPQDIKVTFAFLELP